MAGALSKEPDNINFLSPLGFKFSVRKLPHVNWFIQDVALPAISLGEIDQPNPFGMAFLPGDKISYEPLVITFKVDEDLQAWKELHDWMVGVGAPRSYKEYDNNRATGFDAIVSDATLTIMNSVMNPKFEVTFHDIFPTSLGELRFASTEADVEYITVSATFRYLNYEFRTLDT